MIFERERERKGKTKRERETERERERNNSFVVPLIYSLIGWFLYVS